MKWCETSSWGLSRTYSFTRVGTYTASLTIDTLPGCPTGSSRQLCRIHHTTRVGWNKLLSNLMWRWIINAWLTLLIH